MPKTKTAKKELRKSTRRRVKNTNRKRELKDSVKAVRAITSPDAKNQETLAAAFKKLDKLAKVRFIKKSKANRLKSRLAKSLAKVSK